MLNRQQLIQLIHVAKRDLKMDDDTYRTVLMQVGKKSSCSDMSIIELERVLSYFKRQGFKVKTRTNRRPPSSPRSRALADDADSKKIRALWLFMHQLGVVQDPSEKALAAYVKRITRVEALQWVNGHQAVQLIETLKKWAMRFLPAVVEKLFEEASAANLPESERIVLFGIVREAFSRKSYDPMYYAWDRLNSVLKKGVHHV